MTRRTLLVMGIVVLVPVATMVACGGDEGVGPAPVQEETGVETGALNDAPTGDLDAAAAVDGEAIGDGGSNIDPDAGDDDAGDAAVCNALANDAMPVTSTCISAAPQLMGGALVAGKYHLVGVSALAPANFCQNQFIPTGFKQTLDLTVAASGVGTLQTVTMIAMGGERRRTSTLTPGAGNTSPLEAAATCPAGNSGATRYTSAVANGTQFLIMRLGYGQGQGLYRFRKQ